MSYITIWVVKPAFNILLNYHLQHRGVVYPKEPLCPKEIQKSVLLNGAISQSMRQVMSKTFIKR